VVWVRSTGVTKKEGLDDGNPITPVSLSRALVHPSPPAHRPFPLSFRRSLEPFPAAAHKEPAISSAAALRQLG
jgi:hypothetical protein